MLQCVFEWPLGEVWQCDLSPPSAAAWQVLSDEERQRAGRFLRESDRTRFAASHVALRDVLARKTGERADELVFETGRFGKPFLPTCEGWHFNLSHSGDVALIAVSSQTEVGVDVEQPDRQVGDADGLVRRHFSVAENTAWQRLGVADRGAAFQRGWTRKEAVIKAAGWGLSMPLEQVDVGLGDDPLAATLQLPDGTEFDFELRSLNLALKCTAAVAWACVA